jgi:hypothetical protein
MPINPEDVISALATSFGLIFKNPTDTHWQIANQHQVLINIWPTANKKANHWPAPGKTDKYKSQQGLFQGVNDFLRYYAKNVVTTQTASVPATARDVDKLFAEMRREATQSVQPKQKAQQAVAISQTKVTIGIRLSSIDAMLFHERSENGQGTSYRNNIYLRCGKVISVTDAVWRDVYGKFAKTAHGISADVVTFLQE